MSNGNPIPVNQDLDQLHDLLFEMNEQLSQSLDGITSADLARAVVTEMREVVHRIDLVQSLLFTKASTKISSAVGKVQAANAKLVSSLQAITNITKLVQTVGSFLTLVDDAIDLAKTL